MPTIEYLNYEIVDNEGWDIYDEESEVEMDMQRIFSDEERKVRLTCIGSPATDHVKLVYNAKHLDYLQNRVI
jgi:hypothetical protein